MIALDTNILVYAEGSGDPAGRNVSAKALLARLGNADVVVPVQVLGEFLNVCRRKGVLPIEAAMRRVELYAAVFATPQTTQEHLLMAAALADRRNLAYFDALICIVAADAGATMLLSEDMQDGMDVLGLGIVNPFNAANASAIAGYVASEP